MEPRFTFLTLGIDDLERSLKFYRDGLGLATKGIVGQEFEHGAIVFFDFAGGMKLALYSRDILAHDAQTARTSPSPTEFRLDTSSAAASRWTPSWIRRRWRARRSSRPPRMLSGGLSRIFSGPGLAPVGNRLEAQRACSCSLKPGGTPPQASHRWPCKILYLEPVSKRTTLTLRV
jgi:catechol 2,3-dioxygenase-like lactoylglutathione lyase family enzyme